MPQIQIINFIILILDVDNNNKSENQTDDALASPRIGKSFKPFYPNNPTKLIYPTLIGLTWRIGLDGSKIALTVLSVNTILQYITKHCFIIYKLTHKCSYLYLLYIS